MLIGEALSLGENRLKLAGVLEARTECEHMLMELMNANRSEVLFYISSEQSSTAPFHFASEPSAQTAKSNLTAQQEKQFFDWIASRGKRIPLAYLLGDTFFHSLKLKVGPGCLIPRPETERLVEAALKIIREDKLNAPVIMDIGTGSGAIALAILAAVPEAKAVMVDFSAEALKIARENTAELGFLGRAELIHSDLYLNIPSDLKVNLILSNPPYLTAEDLAGLQPEVVFEPRMALDGGKDGLDFYRKMIPDAAKFLKPQGWLGFEVGAGQAQAVSAELKRNGYEDLRIIKDHQDIERIVLARKG